MLTVTEDLSTVALSVHCVVSVEKGADFSASATGFELQADSTVAVVAIEVTKNLDRLFIFIVVI